MASKFVEKRCLRITKSNLQWLRKYKIVSDITQERPDFLLSNGIEILGVEHFLVDTLWNHGSQTRKSSKIINSLSEKYDCENKEGHEEEIINEVTDAVSDCFNAYDNFSYTTFIDNFRRIFNKHLRNIDKYKSSGADKIGFLIEVPVLDFDYIIKHFDDSFEEKHMRGIPITEDIWKIINQFDKIDFVFLTILKVGSKKNKSYYFDKEHQVKTLCKSFDFKHIE